MSRVENTAESHFQISPAKKEKIKLGIEQLKLKRSNLLERYPEFYQQQSESYQPACLKDFYFFDFKRQFNQFLSALDIALNRLAFLFDHCDEGSESLKLFVFQKSKCAQLLSEMDYLLRPTSNDLVRQYDFFVGELREFERKLREKKAILRVHAYESAVRLFGKAYGEYEKFFNHHRVLPEMRQIRSYLSQASYPNLSLNDPGHIDFLFFCMSISANTLQEQMRIAQNNCSRLHQAVLKSQQSVDSDDEYVLDCST